MKIPIPQNLRFLEIADAPLMIGTAEFSQLVEFWGYTRSGGEYVKKLERCGLITPQTVPGNRCKRWKTSEVMALYVET